MISPAAPQYCSVDRCENETKLQQKTGRKKAYPDVYDPTAPYPLFKLHPLFRDNCLKDSKGQAVKWNELKGKSVALYFANGSKARCRTFMPSLVNAYKTFNESGDTQKVEIVYVPMDATKQLFDEHRNKMPWLSMEFDDPLIDLFKQHYRVMDAPELPKYGYGPRMGTPTLIVIASDGKMLQILDAAEEGAAILRKWDIKTYRF